MTAHPAASASEPSDEAVRLAAEAIRDMVVLAECERDDIAEAALSAAWPAIQTAIRADERERVAQAIEARARHVGKGSDRLDGFAQGLSSAARVARRSDQ